MGDFICEMQSSLNDEVLPVLYSRAATSGRTLTMLVWLYVHQLSSCFLPCEYVYIVR